MVIIIDFVSTNRDVIKKIYSYSSKQHLPSVSKLRRKNMFITNKNTRLHGDNTHTVENGNSVKRHKKDRINLASLLSHFIDCLLSCRKLTVN